MKKIKHLNLSIGQSIFAVTMIIVALVLITSSGLYYILFSRRANSMIESQSREINKQIVLNYEGYIESIIETANYIQVTSLPLDAAENFQDLQNLYALSSQSKRDVVALFLFDDTGRKILGDDISPLHITFVPESRWFLQAMQDPSIFHFISVGNQSLSLGRKEDVISVSRQVSYHHNGNVQRGVLLLELNFQILRNLAGMTELGVGGHLMIIDDDNTLIYSSEEVSDLTPLSLEVAAENILGAVGAKIGEHRLFVNINTLGHTRWRIATFMNIDEIDMISRSMFLIMFIIFTAVLIVTAVLAGFLAKRIASPIYQLQDIMHRIEKGAIDTEVVIDGQKEIVLLGQSFNSMIATIRELMDRIVKEQREKRKSELLSLQNQINPHFLYNSLDSIVWLAEHNRSTDVITAVVALARFFRISISRGATFITVSNEISHVKNYLTIQAIRYANRFRYNFSIDKAILDKMVMKLILQPLVENALYHGIESDGGRIDVKGYREGRMMIFEVRNTGYGLTEARIDEIHQQLRGGKASENHGVGVGLRNVYQRLKLYYGEDADMFFDSQPDESTVVAIRIPLEKEAGL